LPGSRDQNFPALGDIKRPHPGDRKTIVAFGNAKGLLPWTRRVRTDKKENQIFLIYREIQSGAVAKSYMTNGLLIYGEIFSHFLTLNFLIYEDNFFFISAEELSSMGAGKKATARTSYHAATFIMQQCQQQKSQQPQKHKQVHGSQQEHE
jgi:hypothetical protein